jgi:hypothetical protein
MATGRREGHVVDNKPVVCKPNRLVWAPPVMQSMLSLTIAGMLPVILLQQEWFGLDSCCGAGMLRWRGGVLAALDGMHRCLPDQAFEIAAGGRRRAAQWHALLVYLIGCLGMAAGGSGARLLNGMPCWLPDQAFEMALKAAGADASTSVFCDDSTRNVKAAQEAGIFSVLVRA